ncbi:peptidase [Pedobacter yulinensis]|uniref:Peptidase n=1 Tax=Pedobacter yulinensis TaxID=2126353 RepID=A0A2T3HKD0_9SPHI|nr:PepSY-associated TM helix domain-containing protein [Pedobacter yulinensis]PST82841.1 peptidase [Pedobacter yulinensis]
MNSKPVKKKSKDSLFTRVNKWLHLWLGLASGVIVLIVCLTGCIWVFNEEVTSLLEPETNVVRQNRPVIMPSRLYETAAKLYPDKTPAYAQYQQGRAITLNLKGAGEQGRRGGGTTLKINPYTGQVVSVTERKKGEVDFFRLMLNGHRFLWLPPAIGRPIVNYGTLVFVVLLITGLIWWYPKKWNKSTRDKSFRIKWGASFKRVNLDLHNVLGFYALIFLLFIALTGMVYGISWYSKGLYWVTTGGATLSEFKRFESDSLQAGRHYTPQQAMDLAWQKVITRHPESEGFYYTFPDTSKASLTIGVTVYPSKGQFYNNRSYTFDQHTLQEFKQKGIYGEAYEKASAGGKLRRMNYDIHVGSILGFPGKVLAFLVTLIGASLPVTGFLIWYGRKFKKKKSEKGPPAQRSAQGRPTAKQVAEPVI